MSLTAARMRAINAVIDEGSYAAAAKVLGVSQPAVSQAINDLEKAYGVKLFERRGRHLVPTGLCLDLAPLTGEMRRLEEAMTLLLEQRGRMQSGVLRVAIGNLTPGMTLIGKFQRMYPGIQVELEYGMYARVMESVLERDAHVGVLPNVPDDKRLVKKRCLNQDVVALLPLGHRLATASTVSLRQLATERLIFQQRGSVTQKLVDAAFSKLGLSPKPALVMRTHTEVYEAVTSGLGVGFIWRFGTTRKDGTRRVKIQEIDAVFEESVFRRSDTIDPIVDIFFAGVDDLSATQPDLRGD